jgi:hypothetical protein
VEGRKQFNEAVDELVRAQEKKTEVSREKKDVSEAETELAKRALSAATDLAATCNKLRQLREQAAKLSQEIESAHEKQTEEDLRHAKTRLAASTDTLERSENLQRARESARVACEKGDYTNGGSLQLLAAIYANQCNFDRAEYYQKLAVIFAAEDERPRMMTTLDDYRQRGEFVLTKKQAKTPPAPAGQSKGAKGSGESAPE